MKREMMMMRKKNIKYESNVRITGERWSVTGWLGRESA